MGKRKQGKMGVLLLVKVIKLIYIVYQGLLIASTLVNVLYWFMVKKIFFLTSIILVFVPIERFSDSHSIIHLFFLLLFFTFTIFSFIKMIPEILYSKKVRLPYTLVNIFWLFISTWLAMIVIAFSENSLHDKAFDDIRLFIVPNITIFIVLILVLALWGVRREERFQLRATSYEQISRTAKGSPVFVTACTVLGLVFWYLGLPLSTPQFILYIFCLLVLIINLFSTIIELRRPEMIREVSIQNERKLYLIQGVSLVSLLLSFGLVMLLYGFVNI